MARKSSDTSIPPQERPIEYSKTVAMTAKETAEILKNLSAAERERTQLQKDRKDYNAEKRVELNDVQARIDTLLEQEATGEKKVLVDATAIFDYESATVIIKENSTGKVLEKRDMTNKERQTDLTGPPAPAEDASSTEEEE